MYNKQNYTAQLFCDCKHITLVIAPVHGNFYLTQLEIRQPSWYHISCISQLTRASFMSLLHQIISKPKMVSSESLSKRNAPLPFKGFLIFQNLIVDDNSISFSQWRHWVWVFQLRCADLNHTRKVKWSGWLLMTTYDRSGPLSRQGVFRPV